ncbi:uncharacterized protein LOC111338808 [Stylophora pistillata]|uniref:uncharacterized protein LOC111338808 n=1 Tax=Stylophora pistillata TaxID=50429 RepID=UPI000C03DFC7|nr:uncharacterized protein LOC111338808 [Stylophora pistillata]
MLSDVTPFITFLHYHSTIRDVAKVFNRREFSNDRRVFELGDEASESRMRAACLIDEGQRLVDRQSGLYSVYSDAIHKYKSSKDATAFANARKKLDGDYRSISNQIIQVQSSLNKEQPEAAEKLTDLQRKEHEKKQLLDAAIVLAEKVVNGRISKHGYVESESNNKVYHKLQTKPSLAEKLDKYLDNFNKSGQIPFGDLILSLEVLGKSKSLLRRFLLQNPHLSESQFHLTLKLYGLPIDETQNCTNISDFLNDSFHLSQTRAAVQLLCKMRDRLTEDMRAFQEGTVKKYVSSSSLTSQVEFPSSMTSADVSIDAAAHCLFKHVQHQLNFGPKDSSKNRKLLCDKLTELAKQDNGLASIISSLVLTPDDCQSTQEAQTATQLILNWVLEFFARCKPDPRLLIIPLHMLSRVAFMYPAFFQLYLSHLLSWAERMTPYVCSHEEKWCTSRGIQWRYQVHEHSVKLQDIRHEHLTFTNLADHLRHLVTGPVSIADATYSELQHRFAERESVIDSRQCRNACDSLNLNIWEDLGAFLRQDTNH